MRIRGNIGNALAPWLTTLNLDRCMEHASPFARHFAKLVALLVYERAALDEQKLQLRTAVTLLKQGPVTLGVREEALLADGIAVPMVFGGVRECSVQLSGHRIRSLTFAADAPPGDVLTAARALSADFARNPESFAAVLSATPAAAVSFEQDDAPPERVATISAAFVMEQAPVTGDEQLDVEGTSHAAPSDIELESLLIEPTHHAAGSDEIAVESLALASALDMVAPEPIAPVVPSAATIAVPAVSTDAPPHSESVPPAEPVTDVAVPSGVQSAEAPPAAPVAPSEVRPATETPSSMQAVPSTAADAAKLFKFLAGQGNTESLEVLTSRLSGANDPAVVARALDEICTISEVRLREGQIGAALAAFGAVVAEESRAELADVRRAYIVAIRRLAKPAMLAALARFGVHDTDARPAVAEVLQRAGEESAMAVITLIADARSEDVRTELVALLRGLTATPAAISHLLAGDRPLLARTAAELAADFGMMDAELALLNALGHEDLRVRRAVVSAIARLGSPRTADALIRALRDDAPEVRMAAGFALAALKPSNAVSVLGDALSDEQDTEVQVALVQALGRVGTGEAVDRLAQTAEPSRGLFRKKPVQLRVAAVYALASLRVPGVSAALQALADDKERAVKDALVQAQRMGGRRTTRSMAVVQS